MRFARTMLLAVLFGLVAGAGLSGHADATEKKKKKTNDEFAIHDSGTVVLPRNTALDLDTGRKMLLAAGELPDDFVAKFQPNGPFWQTDDVWFMVRSNGPVSVLITSRGGGFSIGNSSAYSPRDCHREMENPTSSEINLRTTAGGTFFCFETNERRVGLMRLSTVAVAGDPVGNLKIEFTTWKRR